MSIISFASLAGSPGVTTAAVAATMTWHRSTLLLEADTSKTSSILPGFLRGETDHSRGMSPLSLVQQRGELTPQSLLDQAVRLSDERYFIPGFNSPTAGLGTTSLWGSLATTVASLDAAAIDVFVDLGRLAPNDPRTPLLQASDSVLIVTRPVLPDIFAATARMNEVRDLLEKTGRADHLGIWIVDGMIETYSANEIHQVLNVPVVAKVDNDPRSAAVYSLGASQPHRFDRSPFSRSTSSGLSTVAQKINEQNTRLGIRPQAATTQGATV